MAGTQRRVAHALLVVVMRIASEHAAKSVGAAVGAAVVRTAATTSVAALVEQKLARVCRCSKAA